MKPFGPITRLSIRYSAAVRASSIVVGRHLFRRLSELITPKPSRAFLIADDVAARLHADEVAGALRKGGVDVELLTFQAGEGAKTRRTATRLQDALISRGAERNSCVVALGGGVCCDLAGFVAASVLRGLRLICIPTTLLAMIDAAIGGKVALDHPRGKNLIGFFYPAELILVELRFLKTLPAAEWKNGLAELVKIAVVADSNLFSAIERSADALKRRVISRASPLILRAIELKAKVIEKDPYERGVRSTLNFGHTIGHAIERELGYEGKHGEAVAIGMALESRLAVDLGILDPRDASRIEALIKRLGLPCELPDTMDARRLCSHIGFDKKRRNGVVYFSLPAAIGRMAKVKGRWGVPVAPDALFEFLAGERCSA